MDGINRAKLALNAEKFRNKILKTDENIYAQEYIDVKNWDLKYNVPILYLTEKALHLVIDDIHNQYEYQDIEVTNNKNYNSLIIKINGDKLIIDIKNADKDNNKMLKKLILILKEHENPPKDLISNLKSSSDISFEITKSFPILLAGLFMITIGLFIQSINIVLGWLFLLGGLLSAIFAIFTYFVKKILNQT